jgi:ATP-binding cassette subfamily F protein 3
MISLNNVNVTLSGRPVLRGVNIQIQDKECLAAVGPNGCGKSTFLKVIAGMIRPTDGQVNRPNRLSIGYLPQEANLETSRCLEEELLEAFKDLRSAMTEMKELEHEMGQIDPGSSAYQDTLNRYAELSHHFEHHDGYSIDARIRMVASGLGFSTRDLSRSCREFSGGWQMRILLAKLLLQKPDVLLLDEPTNHLDLESMLWLENWIRGNGRTVVMVSHERAFMDRLVDRIFCLEMGSGTLYPGNYSRYITLSAERREAHRKAYEEQQKEIQQTEAFIRRFRYNASKASMVQSRVKQLEKIERLEPPFHPGAIHFQFPEPPRSHQDVITLKNVGHRYGPLEVFSGIDLKIHRGEKVGLVGLNGSGKSTLLRILAGKEVPASGERILGERVTLSHFAQYDAETLNSTDSLLSAIEAHAPIGQQSRGRDLLGAFLFTGDAVDKPLRALSGGEKTRFRLARMLFSPANLLLLDEPTNHLDITSRATIETALQAFEGTVVVVSHDRLFMEKVTTRIIEISGGALYDYPGNYGDYLRHLESGFAPWSDQEKENATDDAEPEVSDKQKRLQEREERRKQQRQLEKVQRRIKKIEERITRQEKLIENLEQEMASPEAATDFPRLSRLNEQRQQLEQEHQADLDQWEKEHELLETLEE